jgi:hypothetical protein
MISAQFFTMVARRRGMMTGKAKLILNVLVILGLGIAVARCGQKSKDSSGEISTSLPSSISTSANN